jgi:hypothetical protein
MRKLTVDPRQASMDLVRDAIVDAIAAARQKVNESFDRDSDTADRIEGLFAWYGPDGFHLLRVPQNNPPEFAPRFDAVGGDLNRLLARFAFTRSEHLGYETLPLAAAQMIVFTVADDVIRASPADVGGPVQIALVTEGSARVMPADKLQPVEDTVDAFREHQREFIVRDEPTGGEGDTGIRP